MSKTSSKDQVGEIVQAAGPSWKLDTLVSLLGVPTGASISELASATGWQNHSVRGALAGVLKRKGHTVSSEIVEKVCRYRIVETKA